MCACVGCGKGVGSGVQLHNDICKSISLWESTDKVIFVTAMCTCKSARLLLVILWKRPLTLLLKYVSERVGYLTTVTQIALNLAWAWVGILNMNFTKIENAHPPLNSDLTMIGTVARNWSGLFFLEGRFLDLLYVNVSPLDPQTLLVFKQSLFLQKKHLRKHISNILLYMFPIFISTLQDKQNQWAFHWFNMLQNKF